MNEMFDKAFSEIFGGTATAATSKPQTLTVETLRAALEGIPPEPYAEFMRENGYPIEDGWHLQIPRKMAEKVGVRIAALPPYVRVSDLIAEPIVVNPRRLGL